MLKRQTRVKGAVRHVSVKQHAIQRQPTQLRTTNADENQNQRTNGPVNAHLTPSYHFFDVKAYVSKINLAVK